MGNLVCSGATGKYGGHEQLKYFYHSQILSQVFSIKVHQECTDFYESVLYATYANVSV